MKNFMVIALGVFLIGVGFIFGFKSNVFNNVSENARFSSDVMTYSDALADLCDIQSKIYQFSINENAGWVEHHGAMGKDSTDRRWLGLSDSGVWRVIAGSVPGEAIGKNNIVMTVTISAQRTANANYKTADGRTIFLQIEGDSRIVEKAKLAIGLSSGNEL